MEEEMPGGEILLQNIFITCYGRSRISRKRRQRSIYSYGHISKVRKRLLGNLKILGGKLEKYCCIREGVDLKTSFKRRLFMAKKFFGRSKDDIKLFQMSEFMCRVISREKSTPNRHENLDGELFERKNAWKGNRYSK